MGTIDFNSPKMLPVSFEVVYAWSPHMALFEWVRFEILNRLVRNNWHRENGNAIRS